MLLSAGVREAFRGLKAAAFLAVDAHPSGNILPRKMNLIPKWKAGTLRRNISWCLITAPGLAWGSRFAPALNARQSPSGTSATPEVLITSVLDMAKYDVAVDQHGFLTKETQQLAFTPFTSTKGETPPYGLGSGDVLSSPVGMAFLKAFVFPDKFGEAAPVINWQAPFEELKARLARLTRGPYADVYREELQTRTRVMMSVGTGREGCHRQDIRGRG